MISTDEIREILIKRIDQQKQAVGIVVGLIEPNGRRVVAYGNLASGDPRTLDGDTIFEIGSISKVFTSLLLAEMVDRKEVALADAAAKYLPEQFHAQLPCVMNLRARFRGLSLSRRWLRQEILQNPKFAALRI